MTTGIGTSTHITYRNPSQKRKADERRKREEEAAWRKKCGPVAIRQMTDEERIKYGLDP